MLERRVPVRSWVLVEDAEERAQRQPPEHWQEQRLGRRPGDEVFRNRVARRLGPADEAVPPFARRVIRPGGYLLLSTDYWPEKIDTEGETMYGLRWTIFSRREIDELREIARRAGFTPAGEVDGDVADPVLRLRDRGYTFIFLAFQREPDGIS